MKRLFVLLLATGLLSACQGVPVVEVAPRRPDDIGWIDRQFRTCVGSACPARTPKTLAVIGLPMTGEAKSSSLAEVPQAAPPRSALPKPGPGQLIPPAGGMGPTTSMKE